MQATQRGVVDALVQHDDIDYMYPQKVNDQLFFIERTTNHHYFLAQTIYPTSPRTEPCEEEPISLERTILLNHDEQPVRALVCTKQIHHEIDFGDQPVAFLHMVSETEGYYLEHPGMIDRSDVLIPFTYCTVKKLVDESWIHQQLFKFSLPAHFVLNASDYRLYESLLPLLPRHIEQKDESRIGNVIYFVHCEDPISLKTGIYAYDLATHTIQQVSKNLTHDPAGTAFFAPIIVGDFTFYGGTLPSEMCVQPTITAWLNEDGLTCIELPSFVQISEEEQREILEKLNQ